jgi:hypothetical protein
MWTTIISKFAIPIIIACLAFSGGMITMAKIQKPVEVPECPACNCPEPTVSVQPFDVDKVKGVKNFNYAPQFSGSISVAGLDSTAIRKMFETSINRAFDNYKIKKRR